MDTTLYVHISVLQYYDTNIVFSVRRTYPSDRTSTHCTYGDCVSLKLSAYLTIFQWGYLAGFPNLCWVIIDSIHWQYSLKTFFLAFLLRSDWSEQKTSDIFILTSILLRDELEQRKCHIQKSHLSNVSGKFFKRMWLPKFFSSLIWKPNYVKIGRTFLKTRFFEW